MLWCSLQVAVFLHSLYLSGVSLRFVFFHLDYGLLGFGGAR